MFRNIYFKLGVHMLKFEQRRLSKKKGYLLKEIDHTSDKLKELNDVLSKVREQKKIVK